jgi:DNA-binding NarL/FixJ family response regulator
MNTIPLPALTPVQESILMLIAKGFHNNEISQLVGLTERAVKWHVSQMLRRYDVSNRTELVGYLAAKPF